MNRKGVADMDGFGTEEYSKEELIADMGASFLCRKVGIEPDMENTAAYES